MLRTILTVTLLFLLSSSLKADVDSLNKQHLETDEQIILDLKHLNFDELILVPKTDFAVVNVMPDAKSGNILTRTVMRDVTEKKTTAPELERIEIEGWRVEGRYKVQEEPASATKSEAHSYQWIAPYVTSLGAYLLNRNRTLPWSDHDNRFIVGGTLICRINSMAKGSAMLVDDALVPDAWSRYVFSALQFHKKHPGSFAFSSVEKNSAALTALLDSSNPFLSVDAGRCLIENHLTDTKFVPLHIAGADVYKQAVFTLLLLDDANKEAGPALMNDLETCIHDAPNIGSLKGIALAAFVSDNDFLLAQLNKKISDSGIHTPTDEYVVRLLNSAKVEKNIGN